MVNLCVCERETGYKSCKKVNDPGFERGGVSVRSRCLGSICMFMFFSCPCGVFSGVLRFSPTSQIYAKWIAYSELPLGVWCPVTDRCPIRAVLPPHSQLSQDSLQIHSWPKKRVLKMNEMTSEVLGGGMLPICEKDVTRKIKHVKCIVSVNSTLSSSIFCPEGAQTFAPSCKCGDGESHWPQSLSLRVRSLPFRFYISNTAFCSWRIKLVSYWSSEAV